MCVREGELEGREGEREVGRERETERKGMEEATGKGSKRDRESYSSTE